MSAPTLPVKNSHLTDLSVISKPLASQAVAIEAWFRQQWLNTPAPIYASMDLRNAGFKLAPVDTNLFPAGFNNLNQNDMPCYVQAMQATIAELCPAVERLLLIPESHNRNLFYFASLQCLHTILTQAGFEVKIASIDPELSQARVIDLPNGEQLTLEPAERRGNRLAVGDFSPCCIVLNNDLSAGVPPLLAGIEQNILPAMELGWSTRLKSEHFRFYATVCDEFAEAFAIDPWLISPLFAQCPSINFQQTTDQACLVSHAETLLSSIRDKYRHYQITEKPFLVVKADQGTYGMAVMMIDSPEQLLSLNRKQRNKMARSKGGNEVTKVIIQEGVHSFETVGSEQAVAEPVIYTVGRHVIGGFYRIHQGRGPRENLNAPGMNFQPLPIDAKCHLTAQTDGQPFYLYGVVARLALLAAAKELAALQQETSKLA